MAGSPLDTHSSHYLLSLGAVNVGHSLSGNFPSFIILPYCLPHALQRRLSWEGSVHVLVKNVTIGGMNLMGSLGVFSG